MRTAGFPFGETQPFLKSSQPELHVRAALVMFLPVHHQNRPNKKPRFSLFPCDFMSPVHLTFCCHPLFLSAQCLLWFRNWWLQHISQRESRTSRESQCQCLEMWSLQGLLLHYCPCKIWALLTLCLLHHLPWSWAGMPQLFSAVLLVFLAWIWSTAQQCLLVTSPPGWGQQFSKFSRAWWWDLTQITEGKKKQLCKNWNSSGW